MCKCCEVRPKCPLSGPQTGLNPAFAGLELAGLAPGPVEEKQGCEPAPPAKPGRVVLSRHTAQRGGKTVLVVSGFGPQHSQEMIEALAKRLRAGCGCGGTVKERAVELQGDQPGRVRTFLEKEGFQVAGER